MLYSGYGFYDEEDTGGIITGGAARAKKAYVWTREPSKKVGITTTGRHVTIYRPKRVGFSLEGATKFLYNREVQRKNPWFELVRNDPALKELRSKVASRMKELSQDYSNKKLEVIKQLPEAERIVAEEKYKRQLEARERAKKNREERPINAKKVIDEFKARFPNPQEGLEEIRTKVPNKRAAEIALKVIYGLNKEQIDRLLPGRKRYVRLINIEGVKEQPRELVVAK